MLRFRGIVTGSEVGLPVAVDIPWHGAPVVDAVAVVDVRKDHVSSWVHVMIKTHDGTKLLTVRRHANRTEIVPFTAYNGDWEAARQAGVTVPLTAIEMGNGKLSLTVPTGLAISPEQGTLEVTCSFGNAQVLIRVPWESRPDEKALSETGIDHSEPTTLEVCCGGESTCIFDDAFARFAPDASDIKAVWVPTRHVEEVRPASDIQYRALLHMQEHVQRLSAMATQSYRMALANMHTAHRGAISPTVLFKNTVKRTLGLREPGAWHMPVLRALYPELSALMRRFARREALLNDLWVAEHIGPAVWDAAKQLLREYDDNWLIVVLGRDCNVLYRILRQLGRTKGIIYAEISRPVIEDQAAEIATWIRDLAGKRQVLIVDSGFMGTIPMRLEMEGLELETRLLASDNASIRKIGSLSQADVADFENLPKYEPRAVRLASLTKVAKREDPNSNADSGAIDPARARLVEYYILRLGMR